MDRDLRTADLIKIFKKDRDQRTADLVGIFKVNRDLRTADLIGIFYKGMKGSTDRRFCSNF